MKEYNGFSGKERTLGGRILNSMKAKGEINWSDKPCAMCNQHTTNMMAHCENYFDLQNPIPMCVVCHLSLHSRFSSWGGWVDYLLKIREGWKPPKFKSVQSYFTSALNKEFFSKSRNFPIFVPNPDVWYENLSRMPINIRTELVESGAYPDNYLVKVWQDRQPKRANINLEDLIDE